MMTSNYKSLHLLTPPMAPVWIARGHPRCQGGWKAHLPAGIEGRMDCRLAPSWAALKGSADEYDRSFAAQLAALDPRQVYADLGANAVILCFCEPGVFCHRRVVAEWLEAAMNVEIPELGDDPDGNTELWTTEAYAHYMTLEQKMAWYEALGIVKPPPPVKAHRPGPAHANSPCFLQFFESYTRRFNLLIGNNT